MNENAFHIVNNKVALNLNGMLYEIPNCFVREVNMYSDSYRFNNKQHTEILLVTYGELIAIPLLEPVNKEKQYETYLGNKTIFRKFDL